MIDKAHSGKTLTDQDIDELIDAIESYVSEVHEHMQDEQGDWDGRPCESARVNVYKLLGRSVETPVWT